MRVFSFLDEVIEHEPGQRLTARFSLRGDEEFLEDHFKRFPVMPGVLLLEAVKQAALRCLSAAGREEEPKVRLSSAEEVKFGQFVRPGSRLRVSVKRVEQTGPGLQFDGRIDLEAPITGRALAATLAFEPLSK